jgi:transcriptional regulator with XRE-family HTH domain
MHGLVSTKARRLRHLLRVSLGLVELGRRIKQAREDANLTQQELADRIGIKTAQSISRYERGQTEVSTKRLRRIAEATSKDLAFFITLPEEIPLTNLERVEAELAEVRQTLARIEEKIDVAPRRRGPRRA